MTTQPLVSVSTRRFSQVHLILRLEGLIALLAALVIYARMDYGWLAFVLLLFVPDVVILAYFIDKAAGRLAYNVVHTYSLPLGLALLALLGGYNLGMQLALIWLAHIGMDRLLGFGLKIPGEFSQTHFDRM